MKIAIDLAKKGIGLVSPNPLVGAVIVKDNEIIGKGYHKKAGTLHAERDAINNCSKDLKGSTLYVNLEPCCHFGKTPPCTDAIIENQIGKVIIGCTDPNPLVKGQGIKKLRQAGITVIIGILEKESLKLNEIFFNFIISKRPFVLMKYAMTMDGKIATSSGNSKWISNEESRHNVHVDRNRYSGIMIGVGTLLKDDPSLTCRLKNGHNPIRIICDTNLNTPLTSQIVKTANSINTIIATCEKDILKHKSYLNAKCKVLVVPKKDNQVDLCTLMDILGNINIDSIIIEGGGEFNFSALNCNIVNKIQTYISPKIFGGKTSKTPIEGIGFSQIAEAITLSNPTIKYFGSDILIESEVNRKCLQV
ncbi:MAG: bifunctional diaminohydroxyphosphoribosylaminopyrimidine deaminase/5-amino-6-(5-phosphoribosylamino)uracil reductase RibD [Spirochaetaceae bacterium]|nr:bifunctional diaminohydroxyphosphoribosylaminopyrimidine deaminase/5-amino-6-(5-phosphoribosylamino)uracil reductase RibD [Spirochaetaceae bacterium]